MDSDARKGRPERSRRKPGDGKKPLRVEVAEIDQEILRLLMRRYNLINKLKAHGRLEPTDEKFIREAWQKEVARVSKDPDLSGAMFTLMQQFTFLPRPSATDIDAEKERKSSFNLAPPEKPVHISLKAPLSSWSTCAWLYMAAAAGSPMRLDPCLQSDPELDFIKTLVQLGGSVSREDTAIITRGAEPLGRPDRVVYLGDNEFGFYLALAHYLGQPSRVKFTGATELKMADFSSIRHFLPLLHARLVNLMPKSDGLPARLESAGMLPPGVTIPLDLPAGFVEALILAAAFFPAPFALDLSLHPAKNSILARTLPILKASGIEFSLSGDFVIVDPSNSVIPEYPELPMEVELAAFLMSFSIPLTGEVHLEGRWPDWPEYAPIMELGRKIGWKISEKRLDAALSVPLSRFHAIPVSHPKAWEKAWQCAIAVCVALKGGDARVVPAWLDDPDLQDFLRICGLQANEDGALVTGEPYAGPGWNAPSASWTFALALCACARQGKRGWPLGNPASVMNLWPSFWVFYNTLPEPESKKAETQKDDKPKSRRRILTSAMAVIPEQKIED